ncbi:MAG: adenine-specific methyltransferase EcoRI family protein [Candidatus Borkfalkiaceae bacterium]|nr:adenine-specific methyltransferase EcoRI family protein [Christensenellaceae bacterium]
MAGNSSLIKANKAKNDEFYTQLTDIENEIRHYKEQFKDNIILCNCDDPFESNFFKYFAMNFNFLGLKKLIATSYDNSPVAYTQLSFIGNDKTTPNNNRRAYKIEITEVDDYNGDGAVDLSDVEYLLKNKENTFSLLKGNGDFRSEECIELLRQADIVVTNPPFSLFREYVSQLIEYDKKFLIIGNQNALTYKEIFPLIKDNRLWLGYKSGDMAFTVPSYYEPRQTRYWVDERGQKWRSFGNICWFTNLDTTKRHEDITLYKKYTPEEYPTYDNVDAIEVSKTAIIPYDYAGVMGVPITFLDKYNPEQFEILGLDDLNNEWRGRGPDLNGKCLYRRILIRRKKNEN